MKLKADASILEEHNDFRKDSSCIDATFTLKLIVDKRREFSLETHLALIAIMKAFDKY